MVRNLPLVYFENSNARVGVYMWRKRVPCLKIAASHTHKCISLNRSSITHQAEDRGTNLITARNMPTTFVMLLVGSRLNPPGAPLIPTSSATKTNRHQSEPYHPNLFTKHIEWFAVMWWGPDQMQYQSMQKSNQMLAYDLDAVMLVSLPCASPKRHITKDSRPHWEIFLALLCVISGRGRLCRNM